MRRSKSSSIAAVLAVLVTAAAGCQTNCAGSRLAPPPQLSPVGDTAYYARAVIKLVNQLQGAAIDAEAAGVMKTDDARKIIEATRLANEAGVELAAALKAGQSATTSRERAIAMIRQALTDLPPKLNDHDRAIVQPYVTGVLTLLTVFD